MTTLTHETINQYAEDNYTPTMRYIRVPPKYRELFARVESAFNLQLGVTKDIYPNDLTLVKFYDPTGETYSALHTASSFAGLHTYLLGMLEGKYLLELNINRLKGV